MHCPTLHELPPPPVGKEGWPWTAESPRLPDAMPDGGAWPKISVVTPTYNQDRFIEEMIRSVLLQGYPDYEFIIVNDGSTDRTLEVIEPYKQWVACISQKNAGQSAAVNRGFKAAAGDLIAWQNSDDYYYPEAFSRGALCASAFPGFDIYFGDKDYVDVEGRFLFTRKNVEPTFAAMIPWPCVNNESMFFRRHIFERGYLLNESLRHYMDYDLFWRLFLDGCTFKYVPGMVAGFRQHAAAKSSSQVDVAQREGFNIYKTVYLSGKAPADARELLLEAMRVECHNDFTLYRFTEFRRHFAELVRLAGRRAITAGLNARYLATFLGVPAIRTAKQIAKTTCLARVH